MLSANQPAPSFAVPDQDGATVSLEALKGQNVVLYFYPKDDTPGCTIQACELRDNWEAVAATGAAVYGVSPDSPARHVKFRAKFDLPFPLLADEDNKMAEAFGTWAEKSMYGRKYMGILRTTFIIDGTGVIRHILEKVKPKGHASQVLMLLKEMPGK
jgi:peroxiredoxin Q/BCP